MKLAVIGCGTVAEMFHAPAIVESGELILAAAVDVHLDRARRIAAGADAPAACVTTEAREVVDLCDAALITLPNHLHADVATLFLERGRHVLVEKPMATTTADCDRMIAAAEASGAVLSVAMVRRFKPGYRLVRELVRTGPFGAVRRVDVQEGIVYNWPAASSFFVRQREAGGGVFVDFGSHVLDALVWWLGPLAVVSYADDGCGGVEAEARVSLRSESGIPVEIELSRLRRLSCTARVTFERAVVDMHLHSDAVEWSCAGSSLPIRGNVGEGSVGSWAASPNPFASQLRWFADQVRAQSRVTHTARTSRRIAQLFETCLAVKQPLPGPAAPWVERPALARR